MALIFDELPTAFPWYDKLEKQYRFKENAGKVCDYKLISPSTTLLPFQFRRPAEIANPPISWVIKEANSGTTVKNLTPNLPGDDGVSNQLYFRTLEGYDYIIFSGHSRLSVLKDDLTLGSFYTNHLNFGYYYSVITFADNTQYFSEVFHVPIDAFKTANAGTDSISDVENELQLEDVTKMNYLRLIWYNECDLKPVAYKGNIAGEFAHWRQCVYLDSFITSSEPEIITEGPKDGQDDIVPTFQKAIIKHRVTAIVADYLKIAFYLMQMHDNVNLLSPQGIRNGDIKRFTVVSTVEFNGALSQVDILFEQELALVKAGCCGDFIQPPACETLAPTLTMEDDPGPLFRYIASGTSNADAWVDLYASLDGTDWVYLQSITATDFAAGVSVVRDSPITDPDYLQFKVVDRNFNCTFGVSDVFIII